ncbi:hypothetical protein D9M68_761100 [compost metagenome]
MVLQQMEHVLFVARAQARDDLPVLADRAFAGMRAAVEGQDQRAARHDFVHVARIHRIPRQFGHQDMEFAREADGFVCAVALAGFLFLDYVLLQPRQPGLGDVLQQPAGYVPFQAAAGLEDVVRFFQAGARHRGPAVGPQIHQAFAEQPRQHAADDGPADAETFANDVLGQFVARQEGLFDDGPPEIFVYDFIAADVFPGGCICRRLGGRHLFVGSYACALFSV